MWYIVFTEKEQWRGKISGGFRGEMAPGPTPLVAERGPAPRKKFKLNHRKASDYTLHYLLMLAGRSKAGV